MEEIKLGFWNNLRDNIRNHLINENISSFQNWNEIKSTMIADVNNLEYEYLIDDKRWLIWKDKLNETQLKPNSHVIFNESSTNNLHHAYSLQILMEETGYKLFEFDDVIEFGGGYGNVCRLFKIWKHNKSYYLYDILELTQIQKYYLEENRIINGVYYKTGFDVIESIEGNSLFLGMWSISETPMEERAKLLENLGFYKCKNIFLAMAKVFGSENNEDWLNNILIPKLEILGYYCKIMEIKHINGCIYFVATKKK